MLRSGAFVILLMRASGSLACHAFRQTNMTVVPELGERYAATVTGCIQRTEFETVVTEIYVKDQGVPLLERDAIRHMRQLTTVSLERCQIATVQPAVFRNVPRLRRVRLAFNEFKKVPKRTFSTLPQLEVLELTHNEIEEIEDGAFGNCTTLKKVRVGFNNLEVWSDKWFTNSTNVELIDFQHNAIKVLPRRAFGQLQQLENICFDYNELEAIHDEAFVGIARLEFLGLRYNKLKSIQPTVFSNGLTITKLMLDANFLNYLPMRLMGRIEVKEMSVFGNPWKCSCLDQIYRWLHETNGSIKVLDFCSGREIPVCYSGSSHVCRDTVDDEGTAWYLETLKKLKPPLNKFCARLGT
jgi:Leucine-rich repeat (LRR) protein